MSAATRPFQDRCTRRSPRGSRPLDPARARIVSPIFTWRTAGTLGMPTIADPARAGSGWTTQSVHALLGNPQVHRASALGPPDPQRAPHHHAGGSVAVVTRAVHAAIVDRPTREAARNIAAEHGTSRDDDGLSPAPRHRPQRRVPVPDQVPRLPPHQCWPVRGGDRAACRGRPWSAGQHQAVREVRPGPARGQTADRVRAARRPAAEGTTWASRRRSTS